MVGQNFLMINRKKDNSLEITLENAKIEWTNLAKTDFDFNDLYKIEKRIERIEYLIYCKNYNKL